MSDPEPADSASPASSNPPSISNPPVVSPLGLVLFLVYTSLYLGFVLINAFAADWMDTIVVAGLNLAIVYGFGLIIAAIVMAFIYGFASRNQAETGSGASS